MVRRRSEFDSRLRLVAPAGGSGAPPPKRARPVRLRTGAPRRANWDGLPGPPAKRYVPQRHGLRLLHSPLKERTAHGGQGGLNPLACASTGDRYLCAPLMEGAADGEATGFEHRGVREHGGSTPPPSAMGHGEHPNGEEPRRKRGAAQVVVGSTPTLSAHAASVSWRGRRAFTPQERVRSSYAVLTLRRCRGRHARFSASSKGFDPPTEYGAARFRLGTRDALPVEVGACLFD